jgi:hypothetical protein
MHIDSFKDAPRLQSVSREAFWQRHVAQWRTSGLSKRAYCQQCALTYHQMVYWSKKENPVIELEVGSGGFVAISVSPDERDAGLSVRLPSGMMIEGIDDRSVDLVGKLIAQL